MDAFPTSAEAAAPSRGSRRGSARTSYRNRVRGTLRAAAVDYNTYGETDIEVEPHDRTQCLCQTCGCD